MVNRPRLSKLELKLMEVLWTRGVVSIRAIQEDLPGKSLLSISAIQTLLYRLQAKKAVRQSRKQGRANMFEAAITRHAAQSQLIDEFLDMFGGLIQPVIVRLVETDKLGAADLAVIEKLVREAEKKKKQK
jgi:BlaI family penicillinase repressor